MNTSLPANACFDRAWMLAQIGDDEALMHEIAEVFLCDGPEIRQRLASALLTQDPVALHAAAHCAKSAVGNFGAQAAVHAAAALEHAAKENDVMQFAPLGKTLLSCLIDVESALQQELAGS